MPSVGTVREWNDDEGTGVIDSKDTPGGCWVHFSHIVTDALGTLTPGDQVTFTYEALHQDGFGYQAVLVWPPGVQPGTPQRAPDRSPSTAYQSSLTIRWDDSQELGHLDALYKAVRDSAPVDRQAAFDLAANQLEYFPLHDQARELAEASLADGDEPRLTSAAAAFLDTIGYQPGFEQAPERLARLERALDAVRADMRATGLTGEIRLIRPDWTPNAVVETWAGDHGWTAGIFSSEATDDLSALVAVAEQARQAIMESLEYQSTGAVWPACPAHALGTAPMAHHGTGVWWCDGDGGHVAAQIGHWPGAATPPDGAGQQRSLTGRSTTGTAGTVSAAHRRSRLPIFQAGYAGGQAEPAERGARVKPENKIAGSGSARPEACSAEATRP